MVLTSIALLGCGDGAATGSSGGGAGGVDASSTGGDANPGGGGGTATASGGSGGATGGSGGAEVQGGAGGVGNDAGAGGEAGARSGSLASLGIDPLGRGDGIDLTESNYTGPCYEDPAMEANRPTLPDPRVVAAEEAEAIARASQLEADAAREALATAEQAYKDSFATEAAPPASASEGEAGFAYLAAVTAAKVVTEEAYQIGLVLLTPEATTTWSDLAEHPEKIINELVPAFIEARFVVVDSPALVDFATEALAAGVKAQMLDYLRSARDAALALYEDATGQMTSPTAEPMEPTADPVAQQGFEDAQRAYDEAVQQAIADGNAALEAKIFADTEPSDLPPCDSEELRQLLADAFCSGDFVNPISPEEEVMTPGITARLDAYVARVCAAVL